MVEEKLRAVHQKLYEAGSIISASFSPEEMEDLFLIFYSREELNNLVYTQTSDALANRIMMEVSIMEAELVKVRNRERPRSDQDPDRPPETATGRC